MQYIVNMNDLENTPDILRNFFTFKDIADVCTFIRKTGTINVISLNIGTVRKYFDIFLTVINPILQNLDVIILQEVNVSSEEGKLYNISGFNKIIKCRPSGRGGGIFIFLRDSINCIELSYNFSSAESIILKLCCKNLSFILAAIYRPPASSVNVFNFELEKLFSTDFMRVEKNVLIIGDINICYKNQTYGWSEYLNTLYSAGLNNTIQSFTRVEIRDNRVVSSCIDHINLKLCNADYNSFTFEHKISDHYLIGCSISNNMVDNKTKFKTKERLNEDTIKRGIEESNWWPILDLRDPNDIYEAIVKKFDTIYKNSKFIAYPRTNSRYNPWITKKIKLLIIEKQKIWNSLKASPNNIILRNSFKKIRNRLLSEIRTRKIDYYQEYLSKLTGNTRKIWSCVNDHIKGQLASSVEDNIKRNFNISENNQLEILTETFSKTFKNAIDAVNLDLQGNKFNMVESKKPGVKDLGDYISLRLRKLTEDQILNIVFNLNSNSSPGPDGIRARDIKNNIFFLKKIITHFINQIIMTSIVPEGLKITFLRPVFKTGNKNDTNNYRPIGSVSVLMKIFEHAISSQLWPYINEHGIINASQFGFVPGKSTIDLLELLTKDINKALDENKYVVAVTLDLSKAFDLINYNLLIKKLAKIGIAGRFLDLFKSYLSNRSLKVNIGQFLSPSVTQTCGVIQGSVLAPLLFNIYVSDLSDLNLRGSILQYADDTVLYKVHTHLQTAIRDVQYDLNLITKYFFNSQIKVNSSKTKAIIFRSPKKRVQNFQLFSHNTACLRLNCRDCTCQPLNYLNSIKHLGVYLDSDMKFQTHVNHICNALRIALFKFYKIRNLFPVTIKRILYFALVESIIRYGITLYYTAPQYILNPLKQLQSRILKTLFNNIPISLLNILTLEALGPYVDLTRNYFNPDYRIRAYTGYNLRNQLFSCSRNDNSYGKLLPEYKIPMLLNKLPANLQNLQSPWQVKKFLKLFFNTTAYM